MAILDITGVAKVDTSVADALIQAAQAVKLLGARVLLTGIHLLNTGEVEANLLYTDGPHANEFTRTVSRLIEMRTREYLAEAHRVDFDGAPPVAA